MKIELTDPQASLLLDFFADCLADLRLEIVLTDDRRRQERLKERQVLVEELRWRIEAALAPVPVVG